MICMLLAKYTMSGPMMKALGALVHYLNESCHCDTSLLDFHSGVVLMCVPTVPQISCHSLVVHDTHDHMEMPVLCVLCG